MAQDNYDTHADSEFAPSRNPLTVTPHDTNELPIIPKALYVGTGGTVVLRGVDSAADVTFVNVADGQVLDVRPHYVRATGTTASDIVGLA